MKENSKDINLFMIFTKDYYKTLTLKMFSNEEALINIYLTVGFSGDKSNGSQQSCCLNNLMRFIIVGRFEQSPFPCSPDFVVVPFN